jgi:3-hydroxyacyl-[acyl-carrier-protein] dehydratase
MSRETEERFNMLTNPDIKKIIPHRYPFLLVDRVDEMEIGVSVVAIKNVTINEPFFQGHFPEKPIMPGVLIVEALAQATGICIGSLPENVGKIGFFTGIEDIKFRRQVVPGDVLRLQGEVIMNKRGLVKAKVTATVDGQIAAEGIIKFVMVNSENGR